MLRNPTDEVLFRVTVTMLLLACWLLIARFRRLTEDGEVFNMGLGKCARMMTFQHLIWNLHNTLLNWLTSIDAARGVECYCNDHQPDVAWLNAVVSNAMNSIFQFQNWWFCVGISTVWGEPNFPPIFTQIKAYLLLQAEPNQSTN